MTNRSILEAILFVAEQPVPVEELAEVLEISVEAVEAELEALAADLTSRQSGIVLPEGGVATAIRRPFRISRGLRRRRRPAGCPALHSKCWRSLPTVSPCPEIRSRRFVELIQTPQSAHWREGD